MSSETDHPRQRTVAELLAEHGGGDAAATGRRRRRRESGESDAPGQVVPLVPDPVVTRAPDRPALRDPVPPARAAPDQQRERRTPAAGRPAAPPRHAPSPPTQLPVGPPPSAPLAPSAPAAPSATLAPSATAAQAVAPPVARPVPEPVAARPAAPTTQAPTTQQPSLVAAAQASTPVAEPAPPVRENPTDVMPRFREATADTGPDEDLFTRPIPRQATSSPGDEESASAEGRGGPSTMIGGAPVGAEDWHRARTAAAAGDGTALPAGPVEADEEPAGLGARRPMVDLEKHDLVEHDLDKHDEPPPPRERRLGRGSAAATPTWAGVLVQWIAGALGGAVLWVLFRFLWRNLPVVALASAVLVTVGLVVIVRALLHNDDRRTTIFAVLVGLLLTVSPAILVLLGR